MWRHRSTFRALVRLAALWVTVAVGCTAGPDVAPDVRPAGHGGFAHLEAHASPSHERAEERGYIGVVVAQEAVDVSASEPGKLIEVTVHIGDRVEAGDVVARLDGRPTRERLVASRAQLQIAQADHERARLDMLEANERFERRAGAGTSVSGEEREAARYLMHKNRAAHERARAEVTYQRSRIRQLERQLADATITAPIAGSVASRYASPGVIVEAGTPILRVASAQDLWVRFAVPPGRAARLDPGVEMLAEIEAHDTPVPATVRHIAPEIDPDSQMLLVEAELHPPVGTTEPIHAGLEVWMQPQ